MTTPHPTHDEHDDGPAHEGARVVPLRRADGTTPGTDLVADDAITGQVLTERESAELDRRLAAQRVRDAAGTVVRVVRTGVTHDRTRRAGRAMVRTAGYALAGSRIRREERRNRRRHLDLEQAITTLRVNAKSAEDFHVLRELEETLERRRAGVSQRGRERRIEVLRWTGGVIVVVGGVHVVILGFAAAQSVVGAGSLVDRWHEIGAFWSTVVELSPAGGHWWAWAAGGAAVWAARTIPAGRSRGTLPMWAVNAEAVPADGRDIIPDESAVLSALRHLNGLPALRDAFKQGWGGSITPTWVQVPHVDGKGWRMQLVLPKGVPVEEIVKRKTLLAHNLVRLPVEVWPSEPRDQPGVLDLWVANPGALSGPVDPWPLLDGDGPADYFAGVPLGVNIRGERVTGRLSEANYAVAGIMGSGKSTLIITLLCGAMLDPLVEIDVFVLAQNADYDPMAPRLRTLRTGAGPEVVRAAVDTLTELYQDLEVRGRALKEHGARAVTRKLAQKDARLRPRILVVDECQALFMDADHGEAAADVAVKLIAAARKYGITLVFATPEPSTTSLPRKVMAVVSCKVAFAIGDHVSNDAVLGTGSHKSGVTAVSLEPKTAEGPGDVGTCMARGVMAKPGLLRSHYLTGEDVAGITDRAMTLRAGHVPTPTTDDNDDQSCPDFLTDLSRALGGDKRMRTITILHALADLNPHHYGEWTAKTLNAALREAGVPIAKSDGQSVVRSDDVTNAITLRDTDEGDEYADDDA